MKFALLLALLTSFCAFAQSSSTIVSPAQDSMNGPIGEPTKALDSRHVKRHKKAHLAKKRHHKEKKGLKGKSPF